jgi:hypothetical protein
LSELSLSNKENSEFKLFSGRDVIKMTEFLKDLSRGLLRSDLTELESGEGRVGSAEDGVVLRRRVGGEQTQQRRGRR